MPKVSVIIPTYNYGRFLGEAIQSVLGQTFRDSEVIVVDDGSTDNTKEVVDSFKDSRIKYIYQENRGLSAAQNTGISASRGEYIAILGADDVWLPQNLELKAKLLDSRPDVALACSDGYYFDHATGTIISRAWHTKAYRHWFNPQKASRQPLRAMLFRGCFIGPQLAVIRRHVFDEVGYFDESVRFLDDWDMFVRIVQRFSIATIDMPLAKIRRHAANMSANRQLMYEGSLFVFNKALHSYALSNADLKILKRRVVRAHFGYGRDMVADSKIAVGREKLIAAIKANPWYIRPYIYLVGSLLGSRVILTAKSTKKGLERYLVQHLSSKSRGRGEDR